MKLSYILPRFVRHILPDGLVKFMLEKRFIVKPGLETTDPQAAVKNYMKGLEDNQIDITGKRILVFGYGGRFDVGCGLLKNGAGQVILLDRYSRPDPNLNRLLLDSFPKYLKDQNGLVVPLGEDLVLVEGDILQEEIQQKVGTVDIVLSNSVYEHISQVEKITQVLAGLLVPYGVHFHNIDLRDHFFKYPFEMLTFSERIWKRWLNPTSNHNRYRYSNYESAFLSCFEDVRIEVLERLPEEFQKAKPHILPEFLTGDETIDAISLISVFAANPKLNG